MVEIEITAKRLAILALGIIVVIGIILWFGWHYPQLMDNLGDKIFGPWFYGMRPT